MIPADAGYETCPVEVSGRKSGVSSEGTQTAQPGATSLRPALRNFWLVPKDRRRTPQGGAPDKAGRYWAEPDLGTAY